MSSIKINEKPIKGNKKNNTLVNKQTGLTAMYGYAGNDKYIINNLSKSITLISDSSGKDSLQINNMNGNKLFFTFDVNTETFDDISSEFDIIKKDNAMSIINKFRTAAISENIYDFPKGGAIGIDDFMGNTNRIQTSGSYGKTFGNGYIENIYTVNSTGVKYKYNVKKYIADVVPKVKTFIMNNQPGEDDDALFYDTTEDIMEEADSTTIKNLINIYKNTPINMKITGSKKTDKIFGGNGKDKIKANAGNDIIKAAGGNDIIKGDNGNDKIYGGKGNDKIYGGKGNDTINAGAGTNNIYIAKKDGDDIILNGKGTDTLIFSGEKFKNLKAKFSGNDLVITHTGGKVTLKNYKKVDHSVQFIKAGSTKKAVTSFFPAAQKYADIPATSALAIKAIQANVASWVSSCDDLANIPAATNDPLVNNSTLATFVDNNFNQI